MNRRLTTLLLLLLLFLAVGCANTQQMTVGGESMIPTLKNRARVTVDKDAYAKAEPKRGDIIAFKDDKGSVFIKRIVGLPDEKVEILDKKVYINGTELKEDYLNEQNTTEATGDTALWQGAVYDKHVGKGVES